MQDQSLETSSATRPFWCEFTAEPRPPTRGFRQALVPAGVEARATVNYRQPVTLAEPFSLVVQAGLPVSMNVAGPVPSILAALVIFAFTVAAPSALIVASLITRLDASSEEMPRTVAVSLAARPAIVALADPTTPTSN